MVNSPAHHSQRSTLRNLYILSQVHVLANDTPSSQCCATTSSVACLRLRVSAGGVGTDDCSARSTILAICAHPSCVSAMRSTTACGVCSLFVVLTEVRVDASMRNTLGSAKRALDTQSKTQSSSHATRRGATGPEKGTSGKTGRSPHGTRRKRRERACAPHPAIECWTGPGSNFSSPMPLRSEESPNPNPNTQCPNVLNPNRSP